MNLRYIVIIKRILLVKLETDGGEVYIVNRRREQSFYLSK